MRVSVFCIGLSLLIAAPTSADSESKGEWFTQKLSSGNMVAYSRAMEGESDFGKAYVLDIKCRGDRWAVDVDWKQPLVTGSSDEKGDVRQVGYSVDGADPVFDTWESWGNPDGSMSTTADHSRYLEIESVLNDLLNGSEVTIIAYESGFNVGNKEPVKGVWDLEGLKAKYQELLAHCTALSGVD